MQIQAFTDIKLTDPSRRIWMVAIAKHNADRTIIKNLSVWSLISGTPEMTVKRNVSADLQ